MNTNKYTVTVRMEKKGEIPPSGMTIPFDSFGETNTSGIYVKENLENVGMTCIKFEDDYIEWFTDEEMIKNFKKV